MCVFEASPVNDIPLASYTITAVLSYIYQLAAALDSKLFFLFMWFVSTGSGSTYAHNSFSIFRKAEKKCGPYVFCPYHYNIFGSILHHRNVPFYLAERRYTVRCKRSDMISLQLFHLKCFSYCSIFS